MTIDEVKQALQEIVDKLNDENNTEDTETLEEEARSLTKKLEDMLKMEERKKIADDINNAVVEARKIETPNDEETRKRKRRSRK